jgi:hypothetical protein
MTEMTEPRPAALDQEQLARDLVERARADGVETDRPGRVADRAGQGATGDGLGASKNTISTISDTVFGEMTERRNRPRDRGRFHR